MICACVLVCAGLDGRYVEIVWRYLFTLHRRFYPGSNKLVANPCHTHTLIHIHNLNELPELQLQKAADRSSESAAC